MGMYRILGLVALGIGSYALYRSGALNPIMNVANCAGQKASTWAEGMVAKAKNCSCNVAEQNQNIENIENIAKQTS